MLGIMNIAVGLTKPIGIPGLALITELLQNIFNMM
jgi:hypothetical protein